MDSRISQLERVVSTQPDNKTARSQLIGAKIRRGDQYPLGAVMELDHKKYPNKYSWSYFTRNCPRYVSGLWEIDDVHSFGKKIQSLRLVKIGKKGRRLSEQVESNHMIVEISRLEMVTVGISAPTSDTDSTTKYVKAAPDAKSVRSFSSVGPCIEVGKLVRETKTQYVIDDGSKNIRRKKRPGNRSSYSPYHAVTCARCPDSKEPRFPNGYMN